MINIQYKRSSGKKSGRSKIKARPSIRIGKTKKKKPAQCIVEGCNKKCLARGYCSKHYNQIITKGKIKDDVYKTNKEQCIIVGCSKKQCAHHLCSEHYQYYSMTHVHDGRGWDEVDKIIAKSNRNSLAKRDRLDIIKARHEIIKNAREEYFRKLASEDELLAGLELQADDAILEPDDLDAEDDREEDASSRNGEENGFDQVR